MGLWEAKASFREPWPALNRTDPASERPEPAYGKPEPPSGMPETASGMPETASGIDRWTDRHTDVQVQVFVPLWGQSPAHLRGCTLLITKQGKGTGDHLLPLGDWFILAFRLCRSEDNC